MFERGSVPYEPASFPPGPLSLDCCRAILNGRVTGGRESAHVAVTSPRRRGAAGDAGVGARSDVGVGVRLGERADARLGAASTSDWENGST